MSITAERDARNLLTAKEFVAVAGTVQRANPDLDETNAGRVVTESLKFVATAAARPGFQLAPSRVVDEGWHALILHTRVYTGSAGISAGTSTTCPRRRTPTGPPASWRSRRPPSTRPASTSIRSCGSRRVTGP
ncbi:hypothetical protein [Streptomyces sp. NRRL F-5135]|uniref:hypothetical protein n=1 Tax=Streptomyces sp. NRRL F-5135 TaxID=1463858 RepID=UPI000AB7A561|nr:hypothetical protein [Streptomyces sp. NRRL F-5135]